MRYRLTVPIVTLLLAGLAALPAAADEHLQQDASPDEAEHAGSADANGEAAGTAGAGESELSENGAEDPAAGDEDAADEEMPVAELTPHSAEYRVKISVLSGRLNTSLVRTDTGYEANHRIRPTGLARVISSGSIEEFSRFETTATGIVPVHYVSNDTLTRDKTRADVDFDWESNTISGTVDDEPVEIVLEEFAHDRVSTQYQLMSDLMNGGVAERYVLFDIDEIKILNVSVIGEREIRVPAGDFTAIGVQHQAEGSSRVTTLWCVEELDYLPVLIEQHRHGELRMRASLRDYAPIAD